MSKKMILSINRAKKCRGWREEIWGAWNWRIQNLKIRFLARKIKTANMCDYCTAGKKAYKKIDLKPKRNFSNGEKEIHTGAQVRMNKIRWVTLCERKKKKGFVKNMKKWRFLVRILIFSLRKICWFILCEWKEKSYVRNTKNEDIKYFFPANF